MGRFDQLLKWRMGDNALSPQPRTAEELAESLSVESLSDRETPPCFVHMVTGFRHLRTDARISACRTFFEHGVAMNPPVPKSSFSPSKYIISVYDNIEKKEILRVYSDDVGWETSFEEKGPRMTIAIPLENTP